MDNTTITFIPNSHPEVMGKKVKVKFMVNDREEWFIGVISSYNGLKGEYGIFSPCDNNTISMKLDDEDLEFLEE